MNCRVLGKTGLRNPEQGMGCSVIGRSLPRHDDTAALATLPESLEAGGNLFVTAPACSAGDGERLPGRALRNCRERVIRTSGAGCLDILLLRQPIRRTAALFIQALEGVASPAVGYSGLEHRRELPGAYFPAALRAEEPPEGNTIRSPVAASPG